jgi:AAA domain
MLQQPSGQKLVLGMIELNERWPWLTKTVAPWTLERLTEFRSQVSELLEQQNESMGRVNLGLTGPATPELVSLVAANAGGKLASVKQATKKALASVPLLGSVFAVSEEDANILQGQFDAITIDGKKPENEAEWQHVLHVLHFEQSITSFHQLVQQEGWPEEAIYNRIGEQKQQRLLRKTVLETLEEALRVKELSLTLDIADEIQSACECSLLDARRGVITSQMQRMAEDLVDAKVVTELSRSFSADAQSALIRFSQIAGKAKFSRSSQPSKMTVRQRRHRQEYLDAFDRCVRYIPAWIMTSSQISDYLPSECLFDLVVIDEASQSDITVLPGMLRGKQWLIVGDGKQVSPTESFISEESIDSLRAALPRSPLEDGLLPGQSFFDLCAQAYPKGRVVLSEHFRCAPEIINFSNQQFYDGRLVPLRLPTSSERLSPSLLDVRVPDGVKVGKVNERECDEIVRLVESFVMDPASQCTATPRSIGIISLLGDDQSRLIRGRLLDRIGPSKFKEHQLLVGDPPTFQGAERDIVFLSMVCSPGSVPTQNRLMHAQRMNVALSRARDRMVLVRSIDAHHIPNNEDIKLPVIEFFETVTKLDSRATAAQEEENAVERKIDSTSLSFRVRAEALLEKLLKDRGFNVRNMGVVWNNALCVEHEGSNSRAGLCVENAGESKEEWVRAVTQQRSIERVGWKCLRVDGLSLLSDHHSTMTKVLEFLAAAGVEEPPLIYDSLEEENEDSAAGVAVGPEANEAGAGGERVVPDVDMEGNEAVVISSDDENEEEAKKISECFPDMATSDNMEAMVNDEMQPSQFGEVVQNLDFLRERAGNVDEFSVPDTAFVPRAALDPGRLSSRSSARRRSTSAPRAPRDEAYLGDLSDSVEGEPVPKEGVAVGENSMRGDNESVGSRRLRKYRRLDKYSRDGRWYPDRATSKDEGKEDGQAWYDTDSDLPSDGAQGGSDEDYEPPKKS